MTVLEKSITQIFLAYGILDSKTLNNFIQELGSGLEPAGRAADLSIDTLFHKINISLKSFGLEIRTLILLDENGLRKQIHGITNTDDDYVAKMHGSDYSASEILFFKEICTKLVEERHLSTSDILQSRSNDWSSIETERFLFRLHDDNWLERDASNFWILGPRTHLELRSVIENVIRGSEGENNEILEERFNELPQILFY